MQDHRGEATPDPPGSPAPGEAPAEQDQLVISIARAIAETALEGILAISEKGQVLFANKRLGEIVGLPMGEIYTRGVQALFASAEPDKAARLLSRPSEEAGPDRFDLLYLHSDGRKLVLRISAGALRAADGEVVGSLAMVSDVTEQRAAAENLRRQAMHDALTGLPNRLLFVDRLQTAATRQERAENGRVAVLFLDLDHFKQINDTHGHETGDRVLAEVAGRVAHAVRSTDTVARIGGDEFAVICEGADPASASRVASRVQKALKEPVRVDAESIPVSLSIGLALSPPHRTEDLLRLADNAMYQAKAAGRGSVVTYEAGDR